MTPHTQTGASNKEDVLIRTIKSCIAIKKVPLVSKHQTPLQAAHVDELVARVLHLSMKEPKQDIIQFSTVTGPSWNSIQNFLSIDFDICYFDKS